jgi:hypothetical protein
VVTPQLSYLTDPKADLERQRAEEVRAINTMDVDHGQQRRVRIPTS